MLKAKKQIIVGFAKIYVLNEQFEASAKVPF